MSTKHTHPPAAELKSQTAVDGEWTALQVRLAHMSQLIRDFHAMHEAKVVKDRKDLQLQLQLYRQECVRIHNQFIRLLTQSTPSKKA